MRSGFLHLYTDSLFLMSKFKQIFHVELNAYFMKPIKPILYMIHCYSSFSQCILLCIFFKISVILSNGYVCVCIFVNVHLYNAIGEKLKSKYLIMTYIKMYY